MGLLLIIGIFALTPFIVMLVGLVMAFSSNRDTSKKGGRLILIGFLILLVEVLIGFAICSNMNFGGMH